MVEVIEQLIYVSHVILRVWVKSVHKSVKFMFEFTGEGGPDVLHLFGEADFLPGQGIQLGSNITYDVPIV